MNSTQADTLHPDTVTSLDSLVPLIPLRIQKSTAAHDTGLPIDFRQRQALAEAKHCDSTIQWSSLLNTAATCLFRGERLDAVQSLQRALAWKNEFECAGEPCVRVTSSDWVTIAACSLALEDCESAVAFAVRAWETAACSWQDDLAADCSDIRADAMTLLAIIRVGQHRADRATRLIHQAITSHRQVGAIEQLAADHMILSVCREMCGDNVEAAEARAKARQIVESSLDPSRHERAASLSRWMKRFGYPRPTLLKSSRIV